MDESPTTGHLPGLEGSATDVVARIPPAAKVFVSGFGAAPNELAEALVAVAPGRPGLGVLTSIMLPGDSPFERWPETAGRVTLLYVGAQMSHGVAAGWADPLPVPLSHLPALIADGSVPVDVACIEVAPPDEDGRCHLGLSVDVIPDAVRAAGLVLAEVNPNLPRTFGSAWIDAAAIDACCRVERPLPVMGTPPPTAADLRIAENVAALVPQGATLQLGVGSVLDAVADALRGHRGLGVHGGLFTDGLMRLVQSGAVSDGAKGRDVGRSIATSVIGSNALHEFVADNPRVALEPVSYTHDVSVLASLHRFTAINSAWEVSLDGAINAERRGQQTIGGVGGQIDFVIGARSSPEGRSIIALRSTARNGTHSRIVPTLSTGNPVTTPRAYAGWVVTEHGAVDLSGLGVAERADALIGIADPRHRAGLARDNRSGKAATAVQA